MTNEDKDLLADLLVQWEEAFEEGNDIPASELCAECPQLSAELQEKIESLKTTAWTKRDPARPLTDHRNTISKDLSGDVLVNRYRLDSLLGRGGYGQVFRGFDLQLHRPVAVKIGHARTSSDLLLDEARRVARLKHPSIVAVHDCDEHDGQMFLVFELVEGRSLADVIQDRKLPLREAVGLVATVADGLQYAHKQGCIHRDIKPENILINGEGVPLIADFGVACTLDELAKGRSSSSGTLNYMAPEQIAQETQLFDGRCDVHALGVLLFELLSGRSPFQARTQNGLREQILFRQPTLLRNADPSLPKELEAICSKALAKHPADRHESAAEFASELRDWLERSSKRRRITWIVVAVLLLVALVSGALIALSGGRSETNGMIQDGVMNFDGRTRVVTNLERTLPVTLEAWVKPDHYKDENCQFIIGSDIPGEYGLGIALCGSLLSVEHIEGMVNSSVAVVPGVWSHVAAVFTKTDTRLFLNGELVATASGSSKGGSTNFVIGNVGQDKPLYFFRGQIRSVRISEGERYGDTFDVQSELVNDETTLLVVSEPRLIDGIVSNNDGTAIGRAEGLASDAR